MKLSVILIAHDLAEYICCAASSVLSQLSGMSDIELVFVDNGSTDGTFERFDATRNAFPNTVVRTRRLAQNEGPGAARNVGLDIARGEYIIFLDGDDWLDDEAIATLRWVAEERQPEVFVYNHTRAFSDGRFSRNLLTHKLPEGAVDTVESRRLLIPNLNVAWNKMYARAFIEAHEMRFRSGIYEDIEWNYFALLRAQRLYCTRESLVFYRHRSGSTLRTANSRHFDVFQQWRRVLDLMKSNKELCLAYGPELEAYATRQVERILYDEERLPRSLRRAFFREMSMLWVEFDTMLQSMPRRRVRRMDRLIRWDAPQAYRVVKWMAITRSRYRARISRHAPPQPSRAPSTSAQGAKPACALCAGVDGIVAAE